MEMNMEMEKTAEKQQSMDEMMSKMMQMIHPDAERIALLGVSLANLAKAHKGLKVSDGLDEKLSLMRIDLYALIKDIVREKDVPSLVLEGIEHAMEKEQEEKEK